jgi:hypothetical protein
LDFVGLPLAGRPFVFVARLLGPDTRSGLARVCAGRVAEALETEVEPLIFAN